MKERIPEQVKKLYQNFSLNKRLYARWRWRLCPFEKIEAELSGSGTILDIGYGYGLLANFLALKSSQRQVIGLDNSLERLKIARATISHRSNIKFILKDVSDFNLPICQGAAISDLLHHLPEKLAQDLLGEIFNKLTSGGKLVLEEVGRKPFWKYQSNILIDHFLYPSQKINFQPADCWQKLLEKIGFRVEVVSAHQGLPLADVIFICTKK